jgi:hypothetical protein
MSHLCNSSALYLCLQLSTLLANASAQRSSTVQLIIMFLPQCCQPASTNQQKPQHPHPHLPLLPDINQSTAALPSLLHECIVLQCIVLQQRST